MAHLLEWFWEINQGRSGNGSGPNTLAWSEISAWSALTGSKPDSWEIGAIRRMDDIWIADAREKILALRSAPAPDKPENLPKFSRAARREITEGKRK